MVASGREKFPKPASEATLFSEAMISVSFREGQNESETWCLSWKKNRRNSHPLRQKTMKFVANFSCGNTCHETVSYTRGNWLFYGGSNIVWGILYIYMLYQLPLINLWKVMFVSLAIIERGSGSTASSQVANLPAKHGSVSLHRSPASMVITKPNSTPPENGQTSRNRHKICKELALNQNDIQEMITRFNCTSSEPTNNLLENTWRI